MSTEENMEWARKRMEEWGDMAEACAKMPKDRHGFSAVGFTKIERPSFTGEVGRVDNDLLFHFWPAEDPKYSRGPNDGGLWEFSEIFPDALATSFLEVFRLEDRLCWDFVPEMNSWVVRANGFGRNPLAEELAQSLFAVLQKRLES
jgi:hypothetical protein